MEGLHAFEEEPMRSLLAFFTRFLPYAPKTALFDATKENLYLHRILFWQRSHGIFTHSQQIIKLHQS